MVTLQNLDAAKISLSNCAEEVDDAAQKAVCVSRFYIIVCVSTGAVQLRKLLERMSRQFQNLREQSICGSLKRWLITGS